MNKKLNLLLLLLFLQAPNITLAQVGVHGPRVISVANTIVNEYTFLTANAAVGATSLTVSSNTVNANGRFTGNLAQGDLIMVIQMQGATVDATALGGAFPTYSIPNSTAWGAVTAYNNSGNYEFAQVLSVSGATTINILCGLKNTYTSSGHVQIVRVPRYTTLTVNASLTGDVWNGNVGGVVAVEVQTSTTINAGGSIVSTGIGFRGGNTIENLSFFGAGQYANDDGNEGAEKGEGIAGFTPEYNAINGQFCMGAAANAGGGGNGHNGGGGGGGNAGSTAAWTGMGVSNPAFNLAWALEVPSLVGSVSSGGGRGGNSFSANNLNANAIPPGDVTWGGDANRVAGGLGGRPLDYSTGKLFIGGGGGAGDQNDLDAGPGGRGGGLVFIMSYGTVGGSGPISANGAAGTNSLASGGAFVGKDGAGGGGGGGTVIINSNSTISGITINTNGGVGGNQNFFPASLGVDAYGPGGGGGGGYIGISNGTPTRTATGGVNGTTNSLGFTEFPPKGATSGGVGLPTQTYSNYYFTLVDQTICYNTTATLTATIVGTVPGGTTLNWYATQFGTVSLGTGTSYTTPALTATTTYYVGFCPGHYRLPVTVTVSPQIVINTASIVLTNETCSAANGSITGITAAGGTGVLTYAWNGVPSPGANTTGLTAGSYTLVVTDALGCTATVGPYVITNVGAPVINTTSMVITNATCGLSNGSISGITVSGGTGALTYTWNAVPAGGPSIAGSLPGSFTLVVTDAVGCSSTAGPFVISNVGGVTINATGVVVTNNTCGLSNGSITGITSSSPSGGLTFLWNAVSSPSENTSGLVGGSYTLTVTDATGCTATSGPYTILNQPSPVINSSGMVVTNESCFGNDGSITGITVSGGTGTLDLAWNAVITGSASATSLVGGSYTFTATDDNGCVATLGPIVVSTIPGPSINTSAIVITNATCGLSNGSISGITVSGGTGALTYTWNAVPAAGPSISGSLPGSFTLVVTDAIGCTSTAGPFVISNVGGVTINATGVVVTNNTCGLSNGSITGITSSSPSGGLTFLWNAVSSPSENTSGLVGGSYTLTVTDVTGCTATSGPYTILNQPSPVINSTGMVVTNESCFGNDGSITGITVSGGTGTLDLAWNAVITGSASATSLVGGSYTFTATDDNGCVATLGPITVLTTTGPSINTTAMVITNATCGLNNGSITGIVASGGSGTLTFTWNAVSSPSTDLTGAAPASYTLVVTDAAGCTATVGPFAIINVGGVTINTSAMVISDATCGSANGSILGITASSPSGGLIYDWNGTITATGDLSSVTGGNYTLTVTDASGCTATAGPFTILNIGAPIIDTSAMIVTGTTCGLNNGSISGIIVTGGTGTLTYDWNGTASVDQNLSAASSGSYTLTVTDGTGCTQTSGPFTINTSNSITATATGTDATCFGLSDGSAMGGVIGGNGTISYQWIGGPATQNNTGITAGTYQVIVSDSQGCSDTASVTISEPASFSPTITGTSTICEGSSTTLTATGGGTYLWSTGGSTSTETVSPTSTTTITVDVTNGVCTETATITITVNPLPIATMTGTLIICDGQSTTLTAGGGSTYVWDDSSTGTSITVSPTSTTNYFVVATNSCGSDTAFATVSVGPTFTVDAGPDQTIGAGNTTTISATGGTSFVWTPSGSLGCATCQTTSASPSSTTTYTVTATNSFGCTATDDVTIIIDDTEILFVPDIFAPNGSGQNDILFVRGSGISEFTFRVFDRWGQKVFETSDLSFGWDGNFKNKPLDTGVFVYTLEGSFLSGNKFSQKGNVTLKR